MDATPDPSGPDQADLDAVVRTLTVEQKARLTAGRDMWATHAIPEAGIPSWRMTDGPNGARGTAWDPAGVRALCLPSGSALGATWDVDLLEEVGAALGMEARARSARILLGPTVNIQRSPLAGRTFECLSEDPVLAGRLAAAYVTGVQAHGVIPTVKHFAGNEAEFERNSIDSVVDERTLREIYLRPFEMAVRDGGALGIMTAYNRLNGRFCADDPWLLRNVLRGEWGFRGIVVSDWWALSSTAEAAHAGLDVEMPGPGRSFGPALQQAVESGEVPERELDAIVGRLLGAMAAIGALGDESDGPEWTVDTPEQRELARRSAAGAMVLIRNEGEVLPLDATRVRRLAVVGPNAARTQIMGGGSANLRAQHRTSALSALRTALAGTVDIIHEPGCDTGEPLAPLGAWEMRTPSGEPGIEVSFWAGPEPDGEPLSVHRGDTTQLVFMGAPAPGVPADGFCGRAVAVVDVTGSGTHHIRLSTTGAARLLLDGRTVAEVGGEDASGAVRRDRATVAVDLVGGVPALLEVEFACRSDESLGQVSVGLTRPVPPDGLDRAVAAAREADAVVVVVGTTQTVESEGYDRRSLGLPGDQDALVHAVVAANPATVVVVNSGAPVAMPWLDDAAAVVQAWFGGQELGGALADVLLGARDPGGRMPITVPYRVEDTPAYGNFPGGAGEVRYGEGVLVGYRWYDARRIDVAVPFGHGRSYASFEWTEARLSAAAITAGEPVSVSVQVANVGARPGSEVVQCYLTPPATPLTRPPQELVGFAKVHLEPGERTTVAIELTGRSFSYWHPGDEASIAIQRRLRATPFARAAGRHQRRRGWTIEPGEYTLRMSRSSVEVVAELPITVHGAVQGGGG